MEVVYFSTHRMLEGISRELMTIELKDYLRDKVCKDMNVEMNQKTILKTQDSYDWYIASPSGNRINSQILDEALQNFSWWPTNSINTSIYNPFNGPNVLICIEFEPLSKDKYYLFKQRGLFE